MRFIEGALPPSTPTKELFEKSSLESQKLSKKVIKSYFLKVLEKGSGEKLLSRSFSPGALSLPFKLQFEFLNTIAPNNKGGSYEPPHDGK